MKLLDETDSDLQHILKHFGVDKSRLAAELTRSLDRMKTGNGRGPVLSQMLVRMLTEAWLLGSVDYGAGQIRSGFTILALFIERRSGAHRSRRQQGAAEDPARRAAARTCCRSSRARTRTRSPRPRKSRALRQPDRRPASRGGGKTPNLDQYTVNLTERAKAARSIRCWGATPKFAR